MLPRVRIVRYDSVVPSVRKAVFPAAGLGTRFLPATKAQPKEMLPLVDKPIIQYGVEEAVASGADDIILVTGRGKNAIEDHFDVSIELETFLETRGKNELLEEVRKISNLINVAYVRHGEPLGLGHAVLVTRHLQDPRPRRKAAGGNGAIRPRDYRPLHAHARHLSDARGNRPRARHRRDPTDQRSQKASENTAALRVRNQWRQARHGQQTGVSQGRRVLRVTTAGSGGRV